MTYGLYDTVDDCWLGTNEGPRTFDSEDIARVAAAVAVEQLGMPLGRIRAEVYDGSGIQLKDELPVLKTTREALFTLEHGDDMRRPRRRRKSA